ncbi:hypothetical protein B7Z28_00125 [Candidatus Saccharibacteria bacterium 32-45-3]|nr:MAG: hypothetical protein B7Z28_00125 [Candidatus Saccharibacteria bacterium 32-45-3]
MPYDYVAFSPPSVPGEHAGLFTKLFYQSSKENTMNQTLYTGLIKRVVNVTAVRFTKEFDVIPRRIEFDGKSYELTEGNVLITPHGKRELDVSDGSHQFRLFETEQSAWELISIS